VGARLHTKILEYLPELSDGVLLEIGSDRGEGSTQFFAGLVYGISREFYAVDPSDFVEQNVKYFVEQIPNVHFFKTTGEKFLQNFDKKIAYAYLDNYDWNAAEDEPVDTWEDWVVEMINEYTARGEQHSNENCKQVHLEQTKLIANLAADRCIIQFDDTYGNLNEHLLGKGACAVPWLIQQGWKTIHISDQGGGWILANYDLETLDD
jgi:hypothetical protein